MSQLLWRTDLRLVAADALTLSEVRAPAGAGGARLPGRILHVQHLAAELIWAAAFLGILVATWPSPPWDALLYGGVAMMAIAPFLFYPFSKTLFLAFDLIFRPPGPHDLK